MPEGPELKLSCDIISPLLLNKYIINAFPSVNSRFSKNPIDKLYEFCKNLPLKLNKIDVKGKFMYWTFDNNWRMFCTYGMTGQWSEIPSKHTAFTIQYCDSNNSDINSKFLYFNDPRHFGTIKFSNSSIELKNKLQSLGWCPLSETLDSKWDFLKKKIKKNKPIGELLMDQSIFSGVGNYIRAEALYRTNLNPWNTANALSDEIIKLLCKNIVDIMEESYRLQGASFLTYKNSDNQKGKYSNFFRVYGREFDDLQNQIVKEKMGTRTIHWCPALQK